MIGTAKSLSPFPSGGETGFQVHMVNAAPLPEVRYPLLHLVERLKSGGRMNAVGYLPIILSNSQREVRLDSMGKRENVCWYCDYGLWLAALLLSLISLLFT